MGEGVLVAFLVNVDVAKVFEVALAVNAGIAAFCRMLD